MLSRSTEGKKKKLDMEREVRVLGREDCMCKGPQVGKNLVFSRSVNRKSGIDTSQAKRWLFKYIQLYET